MSALRDEIIAKCSSELIASRDTMAITATVNAGRTRIDGVTRDKFAIWAAKTGVRATIEDTSTNLIDPLRASALTLLDFIRGGVSQTLELNNADNVAMLEAWVAMGKITETQKDELIALGTVSDPVSAEAIVAALGEQ